MRKHIKNIAHLITGEATGSAVVEIIEGPSQGVKLCNTEIDWAILTGPPEMEYRGIKYDIKRNGRYRFFYHATIKD